MYPVEEIVPFDSSEKKGAQVEVMFDLVSDHYDELNHTLSLGHDPVWRKKGILSLKSLKPKEILDVGTGTGDLAIDAYRRLMPDSVIGIDISEKMLERGREKVQKLGLSDKIRFKKQDCMNLSIEDNRFDAVIVAFGVRNFENLDRGLQEMIRVLRPGGKLMILELTVPDRFPVKQGYHLYSKLVIPALGKLISKNKDAYNYLRRSIATFPQGAAMTAILEKNGLKDPTFKRMSFGICTMYSGTK